MTEKELLERSGLYRSSALIGIALALAAASQLLAHGGGLDANGCHTNRKTGEYHCHRAPRAAEPPPIVAPAPRASTPAPLPLVSPQPSGAGSGPQAAACGATRDEVLAAARTLLIGLGYFDPSLPDRSGAGLGTAVRNFQREVFLEPTGIVDGALLVRLAEAAARRTRD